MAKLQIYDPKHCCSSGACNSPVINHQKELNDYLLEAKEKGCRVDHYNLTDNPDKFALNGTVARILQKEGFASLPMVFVDGELISKSEYPNLKDLSEKINLDSIQRDFKPASCCGGGCCGGGGH